MQAARALLVLIRAEDIRRAHWGLGGENPGDSEYVERAVVAYGAALDRLAKAAARALLDEPFVGEFTGPLP